MNYAYYLIILIDPCSIFCSFHISFLRCSNGSCVEFSMWGGTLGLCKRYISSIFSLFPNGFFSSAAAHFSYIFHWSILYNSRNFFLLYQPPPDSIGAHMLKINLHNTVHFTVILNCICNFVIISKESFTATHFSFFSFVYITQSRLIGNIVIS